MMHGAQWEHPRFRVGGPVNRLNTAEWEEGFDLTEADERYGDRYNPWVPSRVS